MSKPTSALRKLALAVVLLAAMGIVAAVAYRLWPEVEVWRLTRDLQQCSPGDPGPFAALLKLEPGRWRLQQRRIFEALDRRFEKTGAMDLQGLFCRLKSHVRPERPHGPWGPSVMEALVFRSLLADGRLDLACKEPVETELDDAHRWCSFGWGGIVEAQCGSPLPELQFQANPPWGDHRDLFSAFGGLCLLDDRGDVPLESLPSPIAEPNEGYVPVIARHTYVLHHHASDREADDEDIVVSFKVLEHVPHTRVKIRWRILEVRSISTRAE